MTVDIDDADDVVVGSLDFTVIRLGIEDPIGLCLDQFDGDHEMLAGLFDGNQLAEQVEEQFETLTVVTEAVLIPNIAFVTEPLRGHDLGLWLVAEAIHRMLPTGMVLMWPYPVLCAPTLTRTPASTQIPTQTPRRLPRSTVPSAGWWTTSGCATRLRSSLGR
ncbi:hypothetical protein [Rhodococcus sp. USK13]|uniref:hypothetical protein n=1 Tax=Rhodococcus sp. USK13 TaxID=2806442 RepID=UPI001BCCF719|nr:hypothetical protein [Rhodococcus sp. USK13]